LAFWVPLDDRIIKAFGSYTTGVIASATVYIILSFFGHFIRNWQCRIKIIKSQAEMEELKIKILVEGSKIPDGL